MKQILKDEEEEEEDDCSVPATGREKKSPKLAIPKRFCECGR
jgi:hypothetical protein